ncbi:MAG: RidA family protein [Kiloniellales bacterium]|nr:RidA family protein [Kiloniellales bacterium]
MRRVIETGLKKPEAPHEWAVEAGGTLYSVHVPIRPDGTIENGSATVQAEVTFSDLKTTLEAAGYSIRDVVLIQIYLTSLEHKADVDAVYRGVFREPLPVRACVAVSELPTPGTIIEVLATSVARR